MDMNRFESILNRMNDVDKKEEVSYVLWPAGDHSLYIDSSQHRFT